MNNHIYVYKLSSLQFLKCLGEDTRLKCVVLVALFGELCVCELVDVLGISQPKVSRHLAQLRDCQILSAKHKAQWVYYSLSPKINPWHKRIILEISKNIDSEFGDIILKMKNRYN